MGEKLWNLAIHLKYFVKDTIGKQLVRSADSVAANIREDFGRILYKKQRIFIITPGIPL